MSKYQNLIKRMKQYYLQTGCYKPEDIRELLGDPCQAVSCQPPREINKYET